MIQPHAWPRSPFRWPVTRSSSSRSTAERHTNGTDCPCSQTMPFATAPIIRPPPDLAPLCPQEPAPNSPTSQPRRTYLSALLDGRRRAEAPVGVRQASWYPRTRDTPSPAWTRTTSKLSRAGSRSRTILDPPLDYLKTVGEGVFLTFFATDRSESYLSDHFTVAPHVTRPRVVHAARRGQAMRTPRRTRTWSSRGRSSCSSISCPCGSPAGPSSW